MLEVDGMWVTFSYGGTFAYTFMQLLSDHILCVFILAQGNKLRVSEVAVRSPFDKFKLPNENGFQPHTVFHFLGRKSLTPMLTPGFRQIHEWAFTRFQPLEASE
jgi:hypothetical protein